MTLEWNPSQQAIRERLDAGKKHSEIMVELGVSESAIRKVEKAKVPPTTPPTPPAANPPAGDNNPPPPQPPPGTPLRTAAEIARNKPPKPPGEKKEEPKVVLTTEPLEAIALKLMNKTMVIYQTPQILFSYLCAVNRGFDVDLAEWITIACDDVWTGRNINYFEEVALKKNTRRDGDGERQDQGVTKTAGAEGE